MRVESYGTGTQVRLPGKSSMEPRIFKFGTPYSEMYASMSATPEDEAFFVHNGVLQLCKRGSSVKKARPADIDVMVGNSAFTLDNLTSISYNISSHPNDGKTLPPKPYRLMMEPTEDFKAIHVICLDTKDNPHEAKLQGRVALELCWLLEQTEDLDAEAAELVERFQDEQMTHTQIKVLHQICYL
eukprot:scaffold3100_cov203-Alexandrium_tamarense.AAC.30